MKVYIAITTDNGADVTIERSRYEHSQIAGVEVDLKALDALLTTAASEARLAYGLTTHQPAIADRAAAIAEEGK